MNKQLFSTKEKSFYLIVLTIIFCLIQMSCKQNTEKQIPKMANYTGSIAEKAMVVSAHPEASRVGVEILKQNGNAIDASIAVQLALAVVYPRAGNLGGGGFMVLRTKDTDITALDFREKAPAAAFKDMYLDSAKNVIPRLSLDGHLAAGIPATVDGLVTAHEKYGSLAWPKLVQPAIDLAQKGHIVSEVEARYLQKYYDDFKKINTSACVFVKENGEQWQAGDTLIQNDLAQTLIRIRDKGRAGFYEGATADSIVAEMKRGNGIITHEDLKNYRSVWRKPVVGNYKNYRIISMPPPSSGGIALLQLCKMVEKYPLREWGFQDEKSVHLMVEAERRVYADRATHLGDPDFYDVPIETLLDKAYLEKRMSDFDKHTATKTADIEAGEMPKESEETTHLSIIDQFGNAVSVTTTLNSNYGSRLVVGGAGFLLNNEMDDFSAKAGVPNLYGLVGNKANEIAAHKRMLSSMTPTIVEKDGLLFMVVGTPGGSTIITSVFQTIMNIVEFDMSMQEAVNALRFHHQWKPDSIFMERNKVTQATTLNETTKEALRKKGHHFMERSTIGRVDAILVLPDGNLEGAGDVRGEDTALGF